MDEEPATANDAAAIFLLNEAGDKVFAGGKIAASDALVPIKNCEDIELGKFIACAAREAFARTGVLLVRNGEKLTRGQRASLQDDLDSGRMTFAEILAHWNLWIDAADFFDVNSPPSNSAVKIFRAVCPPKQMQTLNAYCAEHENRILRAIANGAKTVREIVENVYVGLPPELFESAEKSIAASLEKLRKEKN